MTRRRAPSFKDYQIEGEREYSLRELRRPDTNIMDFVGSLVASMTSADDPETMKKLALAEYNLLDFTEFTFPQYQADEFHKHVAGELTKFALPDEEYDSNYLMLFAPPQHGKLISHDTPVLTTNGWKKHGELRPGDYVFGRDGRPVEILAISENGMADHKVSFSDGSSIKCHGAHEWRVFNRSRHRPTEETWETADMRSRGAWIGPRNTRGGRARFLLDPATPIVGASVDLPVDPYTLGIWLGDGTEKKNCITYAPSDSQNIRDRVESHGITMTARQVHPTTGVYTDYYRDLYGLLTEAGLLGKKHIPPQYFTAPLEKRLELLAGLIDSDGYIYPANGRVTISGANFRLIEDIARLIATLGWRTTIASFPPAMSSSGIDGRKIVYQLSFNPTLDIPTAIPRKSSCEISPEHRRRSIKSIDRCDPEPGRCIQVRGGIYLVGERLIPTHNSELVSTRLPSFWLAHNPDKPVAMVSYAAKLAERNSRNARAVIEDPRFFQIFGGRTIPDPENWRVYDWHIEEARGYGLAVGVGGAITGHGFGLIIIDDPIESWADAQSETIRESTWQWWQGTLKTRLWEGGKIILMMTRWHKDDLAGRILEQEGRIEEGGLWKVLSYPALSRANDPKSEVPIKDILGREFGEALAPSRFSKEYLENLKRTMTRLVWMAEYEQEPTDPEGTFFKVGRFEILDDAPSDICRVHDGQPVDIKSGVRYWDLAATEKSMDARDPDYVVGALVAESKRDGRFWILDVVRGRMEPEQVAATVRQTAKMDGKKVKIRIEQEPGASGKSLIASYVHMLAGYDVEGAPSSGAKTVKAQALASQVNAGNCVLLSGDWNRAFLSELAGFPQVRHDDQVDAAAGAFNAIVSEESRWKDIKFLSV